MEIPKRYLHDKVVLILITLLGILLVLGVSVVLIRFDVSKNPTTIVAYRPNISGTQYQSGKPLDIYDMAVFMVIVSAAAIFLSARVYTLRRYLSIFILGSTSFLMILAIRVAWSIISLQ
jgi:hypothetical protein